MAAPNLLGVYASADRSSIYVIFDVALTPESPASLGFTITQDGVPATLVPINDFIENNALRMVFDPGDMQGDTPTVVYDQGTGVLTGLVSGDPVESFTEVAEPLQVSPVLYASVGPVANNVLAVVFDQPVAATDADLVNGFTVWSNSSPLVINSAVLSDNQREIRLTLASFVDFDDVVEVEYIPGTLVAWPYGTVPGFTLTALNSSTSGLPDSQYPLSSVIGSAPELAANTASVSVSISLNPIDRTLVSRYGPVVVYTGGVFAQSISVPEGVPFVGGQIAIADGTVLRASFNVPGNTALAVTAAESWRSTIMGRVGVALNTIRATDSGITLGSQVVEQV